MTKLTQPIDFILIDEEDTSNLISRMTIEMALGQAAICHSFVNPIQALAFLKKFRPKPEGRTILLLDISMPGVTGWEFIEDFDNLPAETKQTIRVYMLSSSSDLRYKKRPYESKNVTDYLVKPLVKDVVERIIREMK